MSVKQRFDGLDVQAMTRYLQQSSSYIGRRVVNIYNEGGSTYIFKLESSNDSNAKHFLLLESGLRFHPLMHYAADAHALPNAFCVKLRKHVRGLRLERIQQIGTDRVVCFEFGHGAGKHCVLLELYSKGNVVLTDAGYKILQALRFHAYEADVSIQVGQVYPVTYATTTTASTTATTIASATNGKDALAKDASICDWPPERAVEWARQQQQEQQLAKKGGGKKGKKNDLTLKTLLLQPAAGVSALGPSLVEHCIVHAGLDPHSPLHSNDMLSVEAWARMQDSLLDEGRRVLNSLGSGKTVGAAATPETSTATAAPGYILYKEKPHRGTIHSGNTQEEEASLLRELPHADKMLQEFVPHLLLQHQHRPHIAYANFADAVQDFYQHLATQKQQHKQLAAAAAAHAKLRKVQVDQEQRLQALADEQAHVQRQATALERQAEHIDKALLVINSALDSGMDWDQLAQLVQLEQDKGNPIALLIHELDLPNDAMVVRLPAADGAAPGEVTPKEAEATVYVTVSLKESAFANASNLFAKYRALKDKSIKTVDASHKAIRAAEETAQKQLAVAQKKATTGGSAHKRKPFWFEKFHWFITSDNYLVVGGRDAHQNELLVKRYLRPGDAYLHADVHGAASCVLRAKRRRHHDADGTPTTQPVPVSERALMEAGHFTICRSSAWSSRMVTSAWWVHPEQVSKTAPTGEYLSVGSFMIRGKKNFLPPSTLEMGLAVLFRLGDDDSVARHKNERRDFELMALEADDEEDINGSSPAPDKFLTSKASVDKATLLVEQTSKPMSGLSAEHDTANSAPVTNGDATIAKLEKRGLSARDRRLVKKYGSLQQVENTPGGNESDEDDESESGDNRNDEDGVAGRGNHKRGKRSKMKRAKKKYADQDEEDRELAMLALQGGEKIKKGKGKKNQKASEVQEKVAAETVALLVKDSESLLETLDSNVKTTLARCVTANASDGSPPNVAWDKLDANVIEQLLALKPVAAQQAAAERLLTLKKTRSLDNFSSSLGGIIRTIHKYGYEGLNNDENGSEAKVLVQASKIKEQAKWKETMHAEGIPDDGDGDDEDAVDDTLALAKLTGKPLPEDVLLNAIPVCAPYQTLAQYKYRVKLTPGSMKRGKAAKQCIEMFLQEGGDDKKMGSDDDRYKQLIKKVGDNEWNQIICSDVKISAPGASKLVKKSKTNTKKKAQMKKV